MANLRLINEKGDAFAVKLVPKGARYGRNACLVADRTLVEFYDAEYAGKPGFDSEGQFVQRYHALTLLDVKGGLNLYGGEPKWQVSASNMRDVIAWIKNQDF